MTHRRLAVLLLLLLLAVAPAHGAQAPPLRVAVLVVSDALLPWRTVEVSRDFVAHRLAQRDGVEVVPAERVQDAQDALESPITTASTPAQVAAVLRAAGAERGVFVHLLRYEASSGFQLSGEGFAVQAELVIHEEDSTIHMVITGDIAPSFLFTLLVLLSQQQAELALEATLYDAQGAALARAEERETTTMDRGGEVLAELIARAVDALLPEPSAQAAAGGHTPFGASQP